MIPDDLQDAEQNDFLPLIIGALVFSLLVVFVALAFSQTHIAPDRAPCPYNYECLLNINGTLVKEQ